MRRDVGDNDFAVPAETDKKNPSSNSLQKKKKKRLRTCYQRCPHFKFNYIFNKARKGTTREKKNPHIRTDTHTPLATHTHGDKRYATQV